MSAALPHVRRAIRLGAFAALLSGAIVASASGSPSGDSARQLQAKARLRALEAAPSRADLSVAVVESRDPALAGEQLKYVIVVSNLGPRRATRVVITAGILGTSGRPLARPASCRVQSNTRILCALGGIGSKRKATAAITVPTSDVGTVSLTATASSATLDSRRRNNRVTQATRVLGLNSVQGRGVRSTAGDAGFPTVTTEVDARSDPTRQGSEAGTFSIQYAAISASPARGSDLRGRVVCLTVEGNRAMLTGVAESSNSAAYPVGTVVRLAFTDNGEPGAGRDTHVGFLGGDASTCVVEAEPVFELPLIEGNFTVRDGEP